MHILKLSAEPIMKVKVLHRLEFFGLFFLFVVPVLVFCETDFDGHRNSNSRQRREDKEVPVAANPTIQNVTRTHVQVRDKRTLNFILKGLADALGYDLQAKKNVTTTVTPTQKTPSTPQNPPPPPPPTIPKHFPERTTPGYDGTTATDSELIPPSKVKGDYAITNYPPRRGFIIYVEGENKGYTEMDEELINDNKEERNRQDLEEVEPKSPGHQRLKEEYDAITSYDEIDKQAGKNKEFVGTTVIPLVHRTEHYYNFHAEKAKQLGCDDNKEKIAQMKRPSRPHISSETPLDKISPLGSTPNWGGYWDVKRNRGEDTHVAYNDYRVGQKEAPKFDDASGIYKEALASQERYYDEDGHVTSSLTGSDDSNEKYSYNYDPDTISEYNSGYSHLRTFSPYSEFNPTTPREFTKATYSFDNKWTQPMTKYHRNFPVTEKANKVTSESTYLGKVYSENLPILSTSKPKLLHALEEMEGLRSNAYVPPPFDYAFDSTDSLSVSKHPKDPGSSTTPMTPPPKGNSTKFPSGLLLSENVMFKNTPLLEIIKHYPKKAPYYNETGQSYSPSQMNSQIAGFRDNTELGDSLDRSVFGQQRSSLNHRLPASWEYHLDSDKSLKPNHSNQVESQPKSLSNFVTFRNLSFGSDGAPDGTNLRYRSSTSSSPTEAYLAILIPHKPSLLTQETVTLQPKVERTTKKLNYRLKSSTPKVSTWDSQVDFSGESGSGGSRVDYRQPHKVESYEPASGDVVYNGHSVGAYPHQAIGDAHELGAHSYDNALKPLWEHIHDNFFRFQSGAVQSNNMTFIPHQMIPNPQEYSDGVQPNLRNEGSLNFNEYKDGRETTTKAADYNYPQENIETLPEYSERSPALQTFNSNNYNTQSENIHSQITTALPLSTHSSKLIQDSEKIIGNYQEHHLHSNKNDTFDLIDELKTTSPNKDKYADIKQKHRDNNPNTADSKKEISSHESRLGNLHRHPTYSSDKLEYFETSSLPSTKNFEPKYSQAQSEHSSGIQKAQLEEDSYYDYIPVHQQSQNVPTTSNTLFTAQQQNRFPIFVPTFKSSFEGFHQPSSDVLISTSLAHLTSPYNQYYTPQGFSLQYKQDYSNIKSSNQPDMVHTSTESSQEHLGLLTISPPTVYKDLARLEAGNKWEDDEKNDRPTNLKTKEYETRISRVSITGKVNFVPDSEKR